MTCYRDMTFCSFYRDCMKASNCDRPLTDEVICGADKWWGKEGAPIAQWVNKPDCHSSSSPGEQS